MKTRVRPMHLFFAASFITLSFEASAMDEKKPTADNMSCQELKAWFERSCWARGDGGDLAMCSKLSSDVFNSCVREQATPPEKSRSNETRPK